MACITHYNLFIYMPVEIKECKCESSFQDERYGKRKRVYNSGEKDAKCTVCGTKKSKEK